MKDRPSGLQPVEVSAAALFAGALAHCARRTGQDPETVLERLRAGDPEVHGTFRYAIAKGLGEYLGSLGVAFRAVYVYGSAMGEASSPCSDIDIILELDRPTDCVDRLIRGLDIALVTQFRALFPWAQALGSLLDVRTVGDRLGRTRDRFSAGFSGVGTAPVCLWRIPPETQGALDEKGPRRPRPVSSH